jgi:hypothetical protein
MIRKRAKALVEDLAHDLEDRFRDYGGAKVFLDRTRLQQGYEWEPVLRQNLCRSAITIVLLVDSYFKSEYCCTEWAITEGLQDGRLPHDEKAATCFLPFVLQKDMTLPDEVRRIQHEDSEFFAPLLVYSSRPSEHESWGQIVEKIHDRIVAVLEMLSRVQRSSEDWKGDEHFARSAGPKQFTWTKVLEPTPAPPRRSLPPMMPDGSKA